MDKPKVGDLAQVINMHGDFILTEPLRVEYIVKPFHEEWAKLETQLGLVPYAQVVWPC